MNAFLLLLAYSMMHDAVDPNLTLKVIESSEIKETNEIYSGYMR